MNMKSFHLWLFPLLAMLLLAAPTAGQEPSGGILLHRPAAVPSEATLVPSEATLVPSEATFAPSTPSFPSLVPSADGSSDALAGESGQSKMVSPAVTVSCSLAVVLGLFAGLVWLTRKFGSRSMSQGAIPKEVLQSLGSTAIDSRTRITMLRCGNRILVMAQTATGIQPLAEISDPDEVRSLTAACLGDSKTTFASTIRSIEKEKPEAGFVGNDKDLAAPRARGRLFSTA
jgi:flagellar biogenesis protein FliO